MATYGNELNSFLKGVQTMRGVEQQMPAQMIATFLTVAIQPGITMSELAQRLGLAQSSCSRNVAALGEWHRFGKAGYNLVEAIEDPRERRRKIMFLTIKGRNIAAQLLSATTGKDVGDFESPTAKEYLNGKWKG